MLVVGTTTILNAVVTLRFHNTANLTWLIEFKLCGLGHWWELIPVTPGIL